MKRTIVVKGEGNVTAKPDYIEVSLTIKSLDMDYEKSMEISNEKIMLLIQKLEEIGFNKNDLKTSSFNIDASYDYSDNRNIKFEGFECSQRLNLHFDFDTVLLTKTLTTIARTIKDPEIDVDFTVKDKTAVKEAVLR